MRDQPVHEGRCAHLAHIVVKGVRHNPFSAQRGEQRRAFVRWRQVVAPRCTTDHHVRVGVKGQHGRIAAGGLSARGQTCQQVLVAEMHAIKYADREHGRSRGVGIFEPVNMRHKQVLPGWLATIKCSPGLITKLHE